jgi:hypothetical protein
VNSFPSSLHGLRRIPLQLGIVKPGHDLAGRTFDGRRRHWSASFRLANLTPAPPPFSGMNSMPAVPKARSSASMVGLLADISPGFVSSRFTVGSDTPDCSAKSFCSHRIKARAARNCSLVMVWRSVMIPKE